MDISVIVPLYNEAESLPELTAWIERVMEENKFSYEIWFINDGSTDDSWQVIEALREKNSRVKGMANLRRFIPDFKEPKAMSLLLWMPICKTAPMKSPNCIV